MATTRTVNEILDDMIDAFFGRYPFLNQNSFQYEGSNIRFNQTYIAKINSVPTVSAYANGAGGYFPTGGKNDAEDLQTDVPVVADSWPVVYLNWEHYKSAQNVQENYMSLLGLSANVLAKDCVNKMLAKAVAANFSETTVVTTGAWDYDALVGITTSMNGKAAADERHLLVNSTVAGELAGDDRLISSEWHGQLNGGSAYRRWENVAGFRSIVEYPNLPDNSENLSAMAFDPRAFAFVQGCPENTTDIRELTGAPARNNFLPIEHESGFRMMSAAAEKYGEPDIDWSVGCIIGCGAGKQGGSAGALTDYAGHRITSV